MRDGERFEVRIGEDPDETQMKCFLICERGREAQVRRRLGERLWRFLPPEILSHSPDNDHSRSMPDRQW
jgi:hypothetical protein